MALRKILHLNEIEYDALTHAGQQIEDVLNAGLDDGVVDKYERTLQGLKQLLNRCRWVADKKKTK